MRFSDLAARLLGPLGDARVLPGGVRIIAIDGPGGAGKSTFARRLVACIDGPFTLLHTDSFATPSEPTAWWPRLRTVIERLAVGESATFEPYDWATRSPLPLRTVEPHPLVIIEGVSASRTEWKRNLAFCIWIDADADVCRRRGMERDGVSQDAWDNDAAAEFAFFEQDGARDRADLIVDSATATALGPEIGFVIRS